MSVADCVLNILLNNLLKPQIAASVVIPKFAGSNPAEAVGFLKGDKKSSARLPSEGK